MKPNVKLIKALSESYCPNDLNIKDFGTEYCDTDECERCWIRSLDRMEKHSD